MATTPENLALLHANNKGAGHLLGLIQGSHWLDKYLNLEDFLKKSLKIKSALKTTGNHSKALKSH